MKCNIYFLFFVLLITINNIEAQITSNDVDSLGFKQGLWREFSLQYSIMTEPDGFKVPIDSSEFIYLSEYIDRQYFPIIESVGEYNKGLKTGVWIEYYGNGNIKSQIEYKNGVPFGKCVEFWGNGKMKEEFNINNEDSILIKAYETNGDFIREKMVLKKIVIQNIYEN